MFVLLIQITAVQHTDLKGKKVIVKKKSVFVFYT